MEDNRRIREQTLRRTYQCQRLEEELWTAAYEQIWPVCRRSVHQPSASTQPRRSAAVRTFARRA